MCEYASSYHHDAQCPRRLRHTAPCVPCLPKELEVEVSEREKGNSDDDQHNAEEAPKESVALGIHVAVHEPWTKLIEDS